MLYEYSWGFYEQNNTVNRVRVDDWTVKWAIIAGNGKKVILPQEFAIHYMETSFIDLFIAFNTCGITIVITFVSLPTFIKGLIFPVAPFFLVLTTRIHGESNKWLYFPGTFLALLLLWIRDCFVNGVWHINQVGSTRLSFIRLCWFDICHKERDRGPYWITWFCITKVRLI